VTSGVDASGIRINLGYTATTVSDANFVAYVAKARPVGADEDGQLNVEVWRESRKTVNYGYVLVFPRNRPFILSFYVRQLQFGTEVDSVATEKTYAAVPLDSMIAVNPLNHDYVVMQTHRDRGYGPGNDPEYTPIWGQSYPLYDPPTETSVTLSATVTEVFSYTPVIYRRLYAWYENPQLTAYIVSDAVGNVWPMAVNQPYQHIAAGGGVIEIECSFRQIGPDYFGGWP
jgi:hypothetical protein